MPTVAYDPDRHDGPQPLGWFRHLYEPDRVRVAAGWSERGFDHAAWLAWRHLHLSPAATARHRDAGRLPVDVGVLLDARDEVAAWDATAADDPRVVEVAETVAATLTFDSSPDGGALIADAAALVGDDLLAEVPALYHVAARAVRLAAGWANRPAVADAVSSSAVAARLAYEQPYAARLRDAYALPAVPVSRAIELAARWRAAGFSPAQARRWAGVGLADPGDAAAMRDRGHEPGSAHEAVERWKRTSAPTIQAVADAVRADVGASVPARPAMDDAVLRALGRENRSGEVPALRVLADAYVAPVAARLERSG